MAVVKELIMNIWENKLAKGYWDADEIFQVTETALMEHCITFILVFTMFNVLFWVNFWIHEYILKPEYFTSCKEIKEKYMCICY